MKALKSISLLALAMLCSCPLMAGGYAASGIFSPVSAAGVMRDYTLSVTAGEILEFSAADLERRMNLAEGRLEGATVSGLPGAQEGALVLYGVEVERGQYLARDELDELCFVPNESASSASLRLQPDGGPSALISIRILGAENRSPVAEGSSFSTLREVPLSGSVAAYDPDGDALAIQVLTPPQKGTVRFDGTRFLYTPYQGKTGSDTFTFCAVDTFGSYSKIASVKIKIEAGRGSVRFVDMAGNRSQYAAIKLQSSGVFSGEKVGGSWFFHPQRAVARGEFLVMLLAASGQDTGLEATVNTGLPGDSDLPIWLKAYVRRAVELGILDGTARFAHGEIPTRAEAVVMVDRAAAITDVRDYALHIPDLAEIPAWALPSYKDLAAYRMLDLHDGNAYPDRALDNAYAADLLWQLYKHKHR